MQGHDAVKPLSIPYNHGAEPAVGSQLPCEVADCVLVKLVGNSCTQHEG